MSALGAQFLARCERFFKGFAGNETAREAILHAVARDAIRYAAFCGQPEDEIANQHESSRGEAAREYGQRCWASIPPVVGGTGRRSKGMSQLGAGLCSWPK